MKRIGVDFRRTAAGEWLQVRESNIGGLFAFLFGTPTHRLVWYWRPLPKPVDWFGVSGSVSRFWAQVIHTPSFDHTPLVGPLISWRVERKLQDALEEWEHDQPLVSYPLYECGCGRTHPEGAICPFPNQKDTL